MGLLGASSIENALRKLNERIAYQSGRSVQLVVCGGAALIVAGLIKRVTGDVDVLGSVVENEPLKIQIIERLPQWLEEAVRDVARVLELAEDWLNRGPTPVIEKFGLPPNIENRLIHKRYGQFLDVYFIGRLDQIHLKILAAMDQKSGVRHLADLMELEPTIEEARAAAVWLLARDTSPQFRTKLGQVLDRIGHEDVLGET